MIEIHLFPAFGGHAASRTSPRPGSERWIAPPPPPPPPLAALPTAAEIQDPASRRPASSGRAPTEVCPPTRRRGLSSHPSLRVATMGIVFTPGGVICPRPTRPSNGTKTPRDLRVAGCAMGELRSTALARRRLRGARRPGPCQLCGRRHDDAQVRQGPLCAARRRRGRCSFHMIKRGLYLRARARLVFSEYRTAATSPTKRLALGATARPSTRRHAAAFASTTFVTPSG